MPLRLYNTLTRRLEPFVPRDRALVTFYSCGPTVYDDAHIGNFRSFLAADLLRRWIESPMCELATDTSDPDNPAKVHRDPQGRRVVHVMNITDVGHMTDDAEGGESGEDRMAVAGRRLEEAKKAGKLPAGVEIDPRDPKKIADFYTERFIEDARELGLKLVQDAKTDSSLMPRATAHIDGMKIIIERLVRNGYAYVAGTPGSRVVYFDVQKFRPYGRLSGNTLDKLREGAGGRVSGAHQADKRHPADFLLWKEDPAHIMKWDSPQIDGPAWGKGYPGWHIECTAMAVGRFRWAAPDLKGTDAARVDAELARVFDDGPMMDIHSGGEDNIFPHHECEIAQSSAFELNKGKGGHSGYARMWFHPRFLLVEGEKMSKSKGNFYTARDLFDKGIEPAALRLELIRTHYRSNANFTFQGLADSQRMVDRWRRVGDHADKARMPVPAASTEAAGRCREEFAAAMHDDLNIAGAIAAVNQWAGGVEATTMEDIRFLKQLDDVLGVLTLERPAAQQTEIGLFAPGVEADRRVIEKLVERRDARAAKDFKRSDAIRDELLAMGYEVKDAAGGKVEVRRRSGP